MSCKSGNGNPLLLLLLPLLLLLLLPLLLLLLLLLRLNGSTSSISELNAYRLRPRHSLPPLVSAASSANSRPFSISS
jgi:hypothetical protein